MKTVQNLTDDELLHQLGRSAAALPEPPLALQRAALALFKARPAATPLKDAAQAALRQIAALLSFDSWATPGLAHGMRSVAAPTRHLLFSAMGRDIDLRIVPVAEAYALTGQILGPDASGVAELSLPADAALPPCVAALDELGEFRIDGVRRGTHQLVLRLGGDEITLPPIEVGERQY